MSWFEFEISVGIRQSCNEAHVVMQLHDEFNIPLKTNEEQVITSSAKALNMQLVRNVATKLM